MKTKISEIEENVVREYPLTKYKAICEMILEFELQIEYIKKNRKTLDEISGEMRVGDTLANVEKALLERKAEKKFMEDKINGKA